MRLPSCRGEPSIEQRRDAEGLTLAQRFDLYQRGDSYLYHLDPRTKVIAVLAVFVISVLFTNPLFLAPVFFTVILALIVVLVFVLPQKAGRHLGQVTA